MLSLPLLRGRLVPVACVTAAIAAACSGGGNHNNSSASTGTGNTTGTMTGTGGMIGTGGTASTGGGGTGGGMGGPTILTLPQFVHGAAYVDTDLFTTIPVVVGFTGAQPDSVDVSVDGTVTPAMLDTGRFVANVAMTLSAGPHMLVATAKPGGMAGATVKGSLVAGAGSFEFTTVAQNGVTEQGHVIRDRATDSLLYSWVGNPTGSRHHFYMTRLDGAFARLPGMADVLLEDPSDEPLSGYTALGDKGIGAVYRTAKPNDGHWLVKMRILDPTGTELVPAMDLTQGQAAFSMAAAGADASGFSAAWLHISPPASPPPPVEVRFARYDMTAKQLVGPITLDSDQPQPAGSTQGPLILETLSELSIACNTTICLVSYVRDVYNTLVQLNVPKVFVATVDLAGGKLVGTPVAAEQTDWDTQEWGQQIVALPDGSFVLVYQANDTVAAVNPKSACDNVMPRELLFTVKFDATGQKQGTPKVIFDHEGQREYPRIAPHPSGFALFWEDQRSYCPDGTNGFIRMAASVASPDLSMLLDPYTEMPGSIALPPMDPSLALTGTSFVTAWSDNRHGNGIVDIETESYFETYWRK